MQKVKVSPPAADGSVLYARLAPTPPRFAQPSLKTRVTLACFCAQVHAQSGHCSSFLGQEQCRASSQRVPGRHGRSVCSRDQSACARQHAEGCEASGVCSSRVRSGVMQQTQTACDLLMAECQYGIDLDVRVYNATVTERLIRYILSVLR